mmetsp:Transcript_50034/g.99861  ORF Transcript_50034/g.99861 Transcript_50034/m.99861 type:complete len:104 (+) Transcript_50034:359-670(+)
MRSLPKPSSGNTDAIIKAWYSQFWIGRDYIVLLQSSTAPSLTSLLIIGQGAKKRLWSTYSESGPESSRHGWQFASAGLVSLGPNERDVYELASLSKRSWGEEA